MKDNNCALFSWEHANYLNYFVGRTKDNKYQVIDPLTKQQVSRFIRNKTFPFNVAIKYYKKVENDEKISKEQKENAKMILDLFVNDHNVLVKQFIPNELNLKNEVN